MCLGDMYFSTLPTRFAVSVSKLGGMVVLLSPRKGGNVCFWRFWRDAGSGIAKAGRGQMAAPRFNFTRKLLSRKDY